MASFVGSAPPRRAEWSVDDAARFAALKEFKLQQLLSTDKKALATARRLGFMFGHIRKRNRILLQLLRAVLLRRLRLMRLTVRLPHGQRRLLESANGLRAARSPRRGHPQNRKRIHMLPLWAMLLRRRLSCRRSPVIRLRPALFVRMRRSAAAPSAALGATRRGSGGYAHA